ncbi:protoglobin domain-containing protein [Aeoliella sp. ICT_H6.2]|uniref:histidine kinase n=1 Tax=Aeoliella straminimaris TaxID=2954799 RepID=A0A9X2JH96_9BACT|nr:protoglobin domain-containing protein [Aeoliella straminimaris]MCO6045835.1 protoglobin domain-containing protein [Aeoliella straminimaris]
MDRQVEGESHDSWRVDAATMHSRLSLIGISQSDRATLQEFWPRAEVASGALLNDFYQRFIATPELAAILGNPERVKKLVALQTDYLRSVFCDTMDEKYAGNRLRIGARHHQLHVAPQWYLAACAHLMCGFASLAFATGRSPQDGIAITDALVKALLFDACLMLESYGRCEDVDVMESIRKETATSQLVEGDTQGGSRRDTTAEDASFGMTRVQLDEKEFNQRASFLGLDKAQLELLPTIAPAVSKAMPGVLQDFYDVIQSTPELAGHVSSDRLERLLGQVASYWQELLRGQIDSLYATSRIRIGVVHEQIGLAPQWYLAGLARQVSGLLRALPADKPTTAPAIDALLRVVIMDTTFVINAYMEARANRLLQLRGFAQRLIGRLTSAVAILDSECRILFANEELVSMAGIDPGLLYFMKLEDAVPVKGLTQTVNDICEKRQERATMVQKLGERSFRLTVTLLEGSPSKDDRKVAVVLDDVSEVIRMGNSIESSTQHLNRLANAVAAVLWEMDGNTQVLTSLSRGSFELLGWRDVSLLGRPHAWVDVIVPEDRDMFLAACDSLHSLPQTSCEYRMATAEGRIICVSSRLSRMPSNSSGLRIAAVTTDVTHTRQVDRLRLASLEAFTSRMCGVTQSAMSAIQSNLEELQRSDAAQNGSPGSLNHTLNEVKRVSSILSSLTAFTGRQPLQVRDSNLNATLNAVLPELRILAGEEMELDSQLGSELPLCRLDPDEFLLIVSQLIDNSRQATSGRGRVVLSTSCREHGEQPSSGTPRSQSWVELSVTDNGVGMPGEVRRRAIEPFYSAFRQENRYGLGLSMVHGYVTQCGGYLTLRSIRSKGTTVTMHFPMSNREVPLVHVGIHAVAPAKVLVVDSDPQVLQSTAAIVRDLGYSIRVASDVAEALDVAEKEEIDVLITELSLPGATDGIGLSNMVASISPDVGAILISDTRAVDITSQGAEVVQFVMLKPLPPEDLNNYIQEIVAGKVKRLGELVRLSAREREVLQFIATGKSQAEVGRMLGISERTVEQHVRGARQKLRAANTIDAVVQAIRQREIVP